MGIAPRRHLVSTTATQPSSSVRRRWRRCATCISIVLVAVASTTFATSHAAPTARNSCASEHFVGSWFASSSDGIVPVDANGGVVPTVLRDQTIRSTIAPHLGGDEFRIRLSNRFGAGPVTFGRVTVTASPTAAPTPLSFNGEPRVTVAAGEEVLSDPARHPVVAFAPLTVSIHVSGTSAAPSKHWNANAATHLSPTGSGDLTGRVGNAGFTTRVGSWLYLNGLDVLAPTTNRSVVAFGDSITDGFVGATPLSVPADRGILDTDARYPDQLQRRLDAAGVGLSVLNAGLSSNRLLTSGEPLMLGPSGLSRFRRDALDQAGVAGVIVQIGINDLGLPPPASADQLISGYRRLIGMARGRGVKIWLGTLLPASNALVNGTLAPWADDQRRRTNAWIRHQRLADGVIDFDRALRDPAAPSQLRTEFASPDSLHPSLAGYRAMADAIDIDTLAPLATSSCESAGRR
ncbi:GDSL-type esterase/lipase family protein [Gordonia sp. NPDC127522]|uniref:GDSL-type esterase/lipase family protein n=1 Tax=Gordonia sp. NPDC127522 TaxID=3345390 RepID=UPI00362B4335